MTDATAAAVTTTDNHDNNETPQEPQQQQRWFPLESNPTLINKYISKLGFDTSLYEFVDVFSTEEWALEMIPQPVAAVLMLYPLTEIQESAPRNDQILNVTTTTTTTTTPTVWFTKQRIGNACGTIGLLHALMNLPDDLRQLGCIQRNSWLDQFEQATTTTTTTSSSSTTTTATTPIQKAERLETDPTIAALHDEATHSSDNQTNRGNLDDDVETHFIALVNVQNVLYELDGRKAGPVIHGPTTPMTLLQDSCRIIRDEFMARDPTEMRFTITALAPKQQQMEDDDDEE
jgi:ubiquitin carboxyl-terminal hydrolase L3